MDLPLPLAKCVTDDGTWHWAATCAQPDTPPDRIDVRPWMERVDRRSLEQALRLAAQDRVRPAGPLPGAQDAAAGHAMPLGHLARDR